MRASGANEKGESGMARIRIWLAALVMMMSVHTSALAGEVWMDETRITNLNVTSMLMSSEYIYETSDPSVATVTADGTISFHREGRVIISATNGNTILRYPYLVQIEAVDIASFSAELVRLVNEERAKYGLMPVRDDAEYRVCADIRAEEITRQFAHTRPDGRHCDTVMQDYGVRHPYMGENIAAGQTTPAEVMANWMSSDGHRANILRPEFNYLAASCRQGDDGWLYWVQLFTRR